MGADEDPNIELAETVKRSKPAIVAGVIVGRVRGLIWHDESGFDILSVEIKERHIAVPVEEGEWRKSAAVSFDALETLKRAPTLRQLHDSEDAVGLVADHFSVGLSGPPPGPDPGTVPPWLQQGGGG